MIFRVLILSLLLSINAYAKPTLHATTPQAKSGATQNNAQSREDDLISQLNSHGWQVTQIAKQSGFNFDADHWIFNFAPNGKYKAFGTCNYLSGSFKTDTNGNFRISNLDGSNNRCEDGKDEETAIFNMLLLADSYEINGDTLLLKSNGQPLINLKASDKNVNQTVAHKSRKERTKAKSDKVKEPKNTKQKNKSKKDANQAYKKPHTVKSKTDDPKQRGKHQKK